MFTINGKHVTLNADEDQQTRKDKIALALGTLPPLLANIPTNITNGGVYTIESPIFYLEDETIKIRTANDEPIAYGEAEGGASGALSPELLKRLYIVAKIESTVRDFGPMGAQHAVAVAIMDLAGEFGPAIDDMAERIWQQRHITINQFKSMIEDSRKRIAQQKSIVDAWKGVEPVFDASSFVLEKVKQQTEVPNSGSKTDLMVFDAVKLNNVIVGCFYQELIKYHPAHTELVSEYLNQDKKISKKLKASNTVKLMINLKELNIPNLRVKYKMINIFVDDRTIMFTVESLINQPNITTNLKKLIKNVFADMGDLEAYNRREEKELFYGSYLAHINIPLVVLKDLFTNDPNIYKIGYINESAMINTRKNSLNIFIKGNGAREDAGVSIIDKVNTTFVKLKKIPGGADFQATVDSNITTVNKILQYASAKVKPIIKYYQTYIVVNVEESGEVGATPRHEGGSAPRGEVKAKSLSTRSRKKAKDESGFRGILAKNRQLAPDLFIPKYTKSCSKVPLLIPLGPDPRLSEENQSSDEHVLRFPIYGETEPRSYKCPYPDAKYPGLQKNKLPNKNVFPLVPCCFKLPQNNKPNFRAYYNREEGQEQAEQRINADEIGKTVAILAPKRIGVLSPRVDKLLNYITGYRFYRYGIPLSPSSCLFVLNMVTNNTQSEQHIRSELAKRADLCKGAFSSVSTREIAQRIVDPNTYISPRHFKGALEDYYQISYILFSLGQDDFSTYPSKFIRFICPLRKRVVFMIEHETEEHVELIIDEEVKAHVNKKHRRPVFALARDNSSVKKIFSLFKERFNYTLYDIDNKGFVNLTTTKDAMFYLYPWEQSSPNGRVVTRANPQNQYIDCYGQTRLVEFTYEGVSFVGQFHPLPCLELDARKLAHFAPINGRLTTQQRQMLEQAFPWLNIYTTKLDVSTDYTHPYHRFKQTKRMAEYILWIACHVYSGFYLRERLSVDEWVSEHTRVVEDFSYAGVTIRPVFVVSEVMVDGKFIFSSAKLQERVRFNLGLISSFEFRVYATNVYHSFFKDVENFNVAYPAQLALTKQSYFQRTREPHVLNILSTAGVQYLRPNTLYFIRDLFGHYSNVLCLFVSSIEELVQTAKRLSPRYWNVTLDETLMNVTVFGQEAAQRYSIGNVEPAIDIIAINVAGTWFYGILLPDFI